MKEIDYVTVPFTKHMDQKLMNLPLDFFRYKEIGLDERSVLVGVAIECSTEGWQWYENVKKEYSLT